MESILNLLKSPELFENALYRDKLEMQCSICGKYRLRSKKQIVAAIHDNRDKFYCSAVCLAVINKTGIYTTCKQCEIPIYRSKTEQKSKTGKAVRNLFCGQSCAAKWGNAHRTTGTCRSKAEFYLVELIKKDFPNYTILENPNNVIPSGLELDIFIKEKNLGIELNGPTHYFPIYGEEHLKKSQKRDVIKQTEMSSLNYDLFVIDISKFSYFKKTKAFLDEVYQKQLKPLLLK